MSKAITHGPSGYRRGCRCPLCREGHAANARRYRAELRRRREADELEHRARDEALAEVVEPVDDSTAPLLLDDTLPAGPIEVAFGAELGALVGEPPWKQTLGALGRANARIIDQTTRHQRLDVLSGVQLRMMDILDRLRRVPEGGPTGGVPADWTAGLAEAD